MKKPEIIYNINDLTCLTSSSDADVIPQELLRTNHPDSDKTRQLQGTTLEKSTQKPFNRMTMRQKQDLYTRRMIRFSLKNPAQPLTPIRMRMTINHVRISYALAPTFKIEPKHWDSTEGRAIVDSKRNADLKGNPRYDASLPIALRMQEQGIDTTVSNVAEQLTTDMTSDARLTIADFVLRQIEEEQFYASYPFAAYDQGSGMAPDSFCNLQEQNEQTPPMPQMPDVPESFHPVNGNPNE